MNVDATETDLRNIAEVLKMAAILDDRAPRADKARIAAWAEKAHAHRLGRDELLDALQDFYDRPRDRAIGIGDLIEIGRRIKRDRLDREADAEREQRATEQAHKADVAEITSAVTFGHTRKRTPRLDAAERGLHVCVDRKTAVAAFREYAEAKAEAGKQHTATRRQEATK